jgi:hypothetical protein
MTLTALGVMARLHAGIARLFAEHNIPLSIGEFRQDLPWPA